ncbi:MAG: tandem-95 repeat protein [Planctomycetes bacterium]|nr:tandem-95 repeat protein [Planctomycetota bacterium]
MIARLSRLFARTRSSTPVSANRAVLNLEGLSLRIVPAVRVWAGNDLTDPTNAILAGNWVGGVAPEPGDDIQIPKTSGKTMTFTNSAQLLGSVMVEAGWFGTIGGTNITIQGNSTIADATFWIDGKLEFANKATVHLQKTVKIEPLPDNGDPDANILVAPNTTLVVDPNAVVTLGLTTTNNGTIQASANAPDFAAIWFDHSIQLTNNGNFLLDGRVKLTDLDGEAELKNTHLFLRTGSGTVTVEPYVTNTKMMEITGGAGAVTIFQAPETRDPEPGFPAVENRGELRIAHENEVRFLDGGLSCVNGLLTTENRAGAVAGAPTTVTLQGTINFQRSRLDMATYTGNTGASTIDGTSAILTFDNSTVVGHLNFQADKVTKIDVKQVTFVGRNNSFDLFVSNQPNPLPNNERWVIVKALTKTGDFGTYNLPPAGMQHWDFGARLEIGFAPKLGMAPEGNEDRYAVAPGGALNVPAAGGVLANDIGVGGEALTAEVVDGPGHGALALAPDGGFTYTPDAGFRGIDTFTYSPSGDSGTGDPTTVTIAVGYTPPTVPALSATVGEDGSITRAVLTGATAPYGDTLGVAFATDGANGRATVNPDGTITYTPKANWNGIDTLTFWVSDGVDPIVPATMTVTVDPVNDAPVIGPTAITVQRNTPLDIDLRTLVTDVETAPDDLTFAVSDPVNGTIELLPDGHTARFTPDPGYAGAAGFGLSVTDTGDGTSAAETTTGTATAAVNTPPEASAAEATTHAGTPVTVPLVFSDFDGDVTTISAVTAGAHGSVAIDGASVTYTPSDPTYTGGDAFTYTVGDGRGGTATATVAVTLTNSPPDAFDGELTVHAGSSGEAPLALGDPDGDAVTVTGFTQGAHGSVALDGATLVYTATSPTYTGGDTFTYTVDDGHGGTATGTITVALTNDPPMADDESVTTSADTPVSVTVVLGDPDGDVPVITSYTQPASGSVALQNADTFYYVPPSGFSGTVTFNYTVDDGHGGTAVGHVSVTVLTQTGAGGSSGGT